MSAYPPPIENTPIFDSGLFLEPGAATGNLAGSSSTATNLAGGTAFKIPYQTAADTTDFLPNGSEGRVLTGHGTASAPTWELAPAAATATAISGGAANQLLYQTAASDTNFIPNGSTNQILTATTGAAPSWSSTFTGSVSGNASTATTATNLANGTAYQIPYQSAAGTTAFVAGNGTAGQVLTSGAGSAAPSWAAIPTPATATTATNLANGTAYQIPYQSAAGTTQFLPNGSEGQVLTAHGTTSAPTWEAAAAGGGASLTADNAFTNATNTFTQSTNVTTINPNLVSLSSNSGTTTTAITADGAALNIDNAVTGGVNIFSLSSSGVQSANTPNYASVLTNLTTPTPMPILTMTIDSALAVVANSHAAGTISFVAIQLQKGQVYTGAIACAGAGTNTRVQYGLYSNPGTGNSTLLASTDTPAAATYTATNIQLDYLVPYTATSTGIFYAAILVTGANCTYASAVAATGVIPVVNLGWTAVTGLLQKRVSRSTPTFTTLPGTTAGVGFGAAIGTTTFMALY